jgi:signal transduction histidine kinase
MLNVADEQLPGRLLVSHVEPAYRRAFRTYVNRAAAGERLRFACDLTPRGLQPLAVRVRVAPVRGGLGWVLRPEIAPSLDESQSAGPEGIEWLGLGRALEGVRDGVVLVGRDLAVAFANRPAEAMLAPHVLEHGLPLPDPWPTSIRTLVRELLEQDADNAEALVEVDERTAYWVRAHQSGDGAAVLLISDVGADERREQAERDFVANAAHELQSPLTGMANAIEVLLAGAHEEEEPRLRFLGHVARENERLSRLLGSLLVLAQAQATESAVALERVELRPLLLETARTAGGPEHEIDVLCPEGLEVLAHRGLLEHAIANLVANALRHGSKRVVVAGRSSAAGSVSIEVTDSGPGVTNEQRARAFDRFYRGAGRSGEGFGLGLPIARQVARALGGDVDLRPNPRGGTIARLRFRGAP